MVTIAYDSVINSGSGGCEYNTKWVIAFSGPNTYRDSSKAGYCGLRYKISNASSLKSITVGNIDFPDGIYNYTSDINDSGYSSYGADKDYMYPHYSGSRDRRCNIWVTIRDSNLNVLAEDFDSIDRYQFPSVTASNLSGSTFYVDVTVPKISYSRELGNYSYTYIGVARSSVASKITYVEKSQDISCSFSVSGETQLGDGTYKLTAGTKTISCSATSDYSWNGTLKVGSDEYAVSSSSRSVDVTLSKSAWTSTKNISLSVTNSYKTATASKTYHVGQGPSATGKTTDTYVSVNSGRSGTYSTPVTYYGSALVVDSVTISDEHIINYFNITENSFKYDVNIPNGSNGSSVITIRYHDEYGSGYIEHTFNVRLIPSPRITLPSSILVGDTTTITNSSITTGVTETGIYKWQIMKPGSTIYEDIPGYVWVEKSKNLEYVFDSADQYKIKLISSLNGLGGAGYYNEYNVTPYSPVPEPDFTISPATLYAKRNINLHSTTSIVNPPYLDAVTPLTIDGNTLDLSTKGSITPPYVDLSDAGYTYEWLVDNISVGTTLDVTTIVNTPGTHTVKLIVSLGQYSRSVTKTINVNTIAPTLSFNLTPSEGMSYGDTVACTNTSREVTVTPPAVPEYKWTITGSKGDTYVYTSKNCSFTVGKSTRYTIKLDATTEGITSTSVSQYITPLEYYDPIRRYSAVIINDKEAIICSKSQSPYRMNNLQFEKRLNETGSGSMDLLVNNEDNKPDLLASGSDIIIFDNVHPIYFGVITSVNNNNINPFNKTLTKSYYSIEFSEGCRKLSYRQCENSEVITAPYDDIFNMITEVDGANPYTGDVDNFINEYSFSVSNQDMLSQIDSLGEQCGARYRTSIYTYGEFEDALYFSSRQVKRIGGFGIRIPEGSYVFCVGDDGLAIHKVSSDYTTTTDEHLPTDELCKIGSLTDNDPMRVVIIKPNPIIDFKQTYYSDYSGCVIPEDKSIPDWRYRNALAINRTCYNVDDDDSINKHYGKIVCTSPQMGSSNITADIELRHTIDESNRFNRCAYISYSSAPKIVSASLDGNYLDIVIDDPDLSVYATTTNLYLPYSEGHKWFYMRVMSDSTWTNNYEYYEGGVQKHGTQIRHGWLLPMGGWTSQNLNELIGLRLLLGRVLCVSSGYDINSFWVTDGQDVNIGGQLFTVSSHIFYAPDTWVLYLLPPNDSTTNKNYPVCIPIGALVQNNDEYYQDSPYALYKDRCLSVTLQNNLDYYDVSLLTSNIARYGSNFTKEVNGTCSIKVFRNRFTNLYPLPGEHVALYYDDGSSPSDKSKYYHDYELVSYTINTQTMTVDFVMGMQPLNVGDVIYRIKQNMTTNITSS